MNGLRSTELASSLLATDFYQLTMLHAYREAGLHERASFEFFFRRLPPTRGFLVAAGLEILLEKLETAQFSQAELDWLRSTGRFPESFVNDLAGWRFTGDVHAVSEGTIIFQNEPIIRIEAPIWEAQLVETLTINFLHYQTLVASKAARCVLAAPRARLIDFGLRRAHSLEAGLYAARAAYVAGFSGTASVHAGAAFGIPVYGTMAHSFIQAHDDESRAFLDFARARPDDTIFLIDTYDTEAGAHIVAAIADKLRQLGIPVRGVRIDSGDLAAHACAVRKILDESGLSVTRIIASGGLDEWKLRDLVAQGAPIDTYGIGTSLTTSEDVPMLDCAYKLVEYGGVPRQKRSEGKVLWPGSKQVYRQYDSSGCLERDILGLAGEKLEGEPLLWPVMRDGRAELMTLDANRKRTQRGLQRLPHRLRDLGTPSDYPVEISDGLLRLAAELAKHGR